MKFDEIKKTRQEWKRNTLYGTYSPEEIDWLKYARSETSEGETYKTPELPLAARFEGMWMIGGQGTGKTQFYKNQAKHDLDMVAAGKAAMIVLDPTGCEPAVSEDGQLIESATLIHTITRLKRFAKGGDLHRRLVYIDPTAKQYTIPINLFANSPDLDDEDAISGAIESWISIISGLMRQPLTPFQEPVLRYAVQVAMAFDNPTLATLRDVLTVHTETKNYTPPPPAYLNVLHKLDPDIQAYMRSTYDTSTPRASRAEVLNRIASLTADPKFRRIFATTEKPKEDIDFGKLMNEPYVTVINASRASLQSMKELYGRYFLSLIKQAGQTRPPGAIPCFIYIDECNEFVANDQSAADIIFKLRRKRVALMIGNQTVDSITGDTRRAFLATAIKLVNANEEDSAKELAPIMNLTDENGRIDPRSLIGRPKFDFAYHIQRQMERPTSFKFKPGVLEAQPAMTEQEWSEVWTDLLDHYYVPTKRAKPREPEPTLSAPPMNEPPDETPKERKTYARRTVALGALPHLLKP